MLKTLATAFIVSSLAAGVAALADQQDPTLDQQGLAAQKMDKITLSGCIQTVPPPRTAPVPSAPATPKFALALAKIIYLAPVGTGGPAPANKRYLLEGDEKNISGHVNHQVEITGTLRHAAATGPATGAAAPTLQMDSVKMVATTCE